MFYTAHCTDTPAQMRYCLWKEKCRWLETKSYKNQTKNWGFSLSVKYWGSFAISILLRQSDVESDVRGMKINALRNLILRKKGKFPFCNLPLHKESLSKKDEMPNFNSVDVIQQGWPNLLYVWVAYRKTQVTKNRKVKNLKTPIYLKSTLLWHHNFFLNDLRK